jgi:hypothetical protein
MADGQTDGWTDRWTDVDSWMGHETKSFQNQFGKINIHILSTNSTMSCSTFHEIKAIIWQIRHTGRWADR